MGRRNDIDWEAIQRDYRLGQLTLRQLGAKHSVSAGAISRKAEKDDWARDLTKEVQERTRAALFNNATQSNISETIEAAVQTNVTVVREHRADIRSAREIAKLLLEQLQAAAENRDEIEDSIDEETRGGADNGKRRAAMRKAVSLSSHSSVLTNLSVAFKNLVALERQAFGFDNGELPEEPATKADIASAVRRLDAQQRDQLRSIARAIVERPEGDAMGTR